MFILTFIYSCRNEIEITPLSNQSIDDFNDSTQQIRREYYENKMHEKNITFEYAGECDEGIRDTIFNYKTVKIDSIQRNDGNLSIYIRFKDACCEDFLGDTKKVKDTLIFGFEQVNAEACACLCIYHYKLQFNKISPRIKFVKIRKL
jgi:hypothetical protein